MKKEIDARHPHQGREEPVVGAPERRRAATPHLRPPTLADGEQDAHHREQTDERDRRAVVHAAHGLGSEPLLELGRAGAVDLHRERGHNERREAREHAEVVLEGPQLGDLVEDEEPRDQVEAADEHVTHPRAVVRAERFTPVPDSLDEGSAADDQRDRKQDPDQADPDPQREVRAHVAERPAGQADPDGAIRRRQEVPRRPRADLPHEKPPSRCGTEA